MGIFTLFSSVIFISAFVLNADAYLSEDRIYYGADSYTVDYNKEIIYAERHAFFKTETRQVNADKIIIYYSKNKKRAEFFENVVLRDLKKVVQIKGKNARAFFKEDIYEVEGDAVYTDENRQINSQKIRTVGKNGGSEETRFSGDVRYSDEAYVIHAADLFILEGLSEFNENVEVHDREEGDHIYCGSLSYFEETGDIIFLDDVLYIQKEEKENEESLIIKSNAIRYFQENDIFLLLGNSLILNGELSIKASTAKYFRKEGILKASGQVVVNDGKKYIYCNDLSFDVDAKKVVIYNSVRGLFSTEEELSVEP
jgi:lipopolysaccharide export system protein LptA